MMNSNQETIQTDCIYDIHNCVTSLDMNTFFNYPYLVELNLSGTNIAWLPFSISNCVLLARINIAETLITRPPSILFSLPQLRANPSNIIFGNHQVCSESLAMHIIEETELQNHLLLNFKDINGNEQIISCVPQMSTIMLILMVYPEFKSFVNYLGLVRSTKLLNTTFPLKINPDDSPIGLYYIPDSIWSIEFKYLPMPYMYPMSVLPLLQSYVQEQCDKFHQKDPNLSTISYELNKIRNEEEFKLILSKLETNPYLSSRCFDVELQSGKVISIFLNRLYVSVLFENKTYFTFLNNSLSFDYVQMDGVSYYLLIFGDKVLPIKEKSLHEIPTLLSYCPIDSNESKEKKKLISTDRFSSIVSKSIPIYLEAKRIKSIGLVNPPYSDEKLAMYREVKGQRIQLTPINRTVKTGQ